MVSKTVYGWVVDWGSSTKYNQITIDLFFSTPEKLKEAVPWIDLEKQQLVQIQVPDDFNNLDYVPDNY